MKQKTSSRILALLLSVMMIIGMLPMTAFAAGDGSAQDAVVTLTVSNKGVLATANDGSVMANRKVTVKDINSDGYLTFDEALTAAHAAYNSEAGYRGGSYVSKLWGVETGNCLFFINDVGLSESVGSDTVKDGDRLVASINADDKYYGDWYAAFDKVSATATVGEDITLTLKGHPGMAGGEQATDTGLSGISVGVMSEDGFSALDGKVTDDDGKVTVSFDTAGTYYVTASGTVEDTVTDWNLMDMNGSNYGVMVDWGTGEASMAYTENDYGDGPYPADEVKWVDFETWRENQDSYHTLHSNQLIEDCPIIAPVCVVTVEEAVTAFNLTNFEMTGTPGFDDKIEGYTEGTFFQLDEQGEATGNTGLAKGCYNYVMYVSEDTAEIKPPVGLRIKLDFLEGTEEDVIKFSVYINGEKSVGPIEFEPRSATNSFALQMQIARNFSAPLTFKEGENQILLELRAEDETNPELTAIYKFTIKKVPLEIPDIGIEDNPYLIKTGADLKELADKVESGDSCEGVYYRFANDITLPDDWMPIGTNKAFSGIIDGAGYTLTVPAGSLSLIGRPVGAVIKNLNIYGEKIPGYGLIEGYAVGCTATIDNVTIKSGSHILKSGFYGGYGNTSVDIYNSTVEKDVVIGDDGTWDDLGDTSYTYQWVGTFNHQDCIGSFAGAWNGTISNCVSYATVYGRNNVGGIAGFKGQSMRDCIINDCAFYGNIIATGNHVGGILGNGYTASSAPGSPCATIENCYATGNIKGADCVGGIFGGEGGVQGTANNGIGRVRNNYFSGKVSATDGSYVGGIIGFMKSMNRYNDVRNNYFVEGCGADKGIGRIEKLIDKDSGNFLQYQHFGRDDDPLQSEAVTKKIAQAQLTDGTLKDLLNSGKFGRSDWQQGEEYPVFGNEKHVTGIKSYDFESNPEKSLNTGDDYSKLYDYTITVRYSDGTSETIKASEGEFSGLDFTKPGYQLATLLYKNYELCFGVQINKPITGSITVKFSLLGDTKHDKEEEEQHTLAGGNLQEWLAEEEFEVPDNSTVLNLIERIFAQKDISFKNPTYNYITEITKGDVTLAEFDNGPNSGWMYTLNGEHSKLGIAEQYLEDGDVIVFHYTDDYTLEGAFEEPEQTAEDVMALINAIGTVTPHSGDAIAAARTAYDSLSAAEKEKVTNYTTLTAAEKAYAQLIQGNESFEETYKATGDYLASFGVPGVGSTGGEWIVIGLARSDREVADGYYEAVLQFVKEKINDAEQLHRVKSTENSRIILALTALGLDVTDVGGHNLLQGLTDMDYVAAQGINGPIWALIAFDSAGYEIPAALEGTEQVTREKLITYILEKQLDDGGWALSGKTADPDMTGMALQALAPYYDSNSEVKAAVDQALDCLSAMQRADGGFASWGTVNAESCAQVIVALTALGIDPDNDPRFIKNDCSVLDALLSFAVDGGGFKHTASGDVNSMATEQGYYALVAYDRFLNDKTSLYDMSDVIGGTEEPPVTEDKDVTLNDVNGSGVTVTGKESILNGLELEANLLTSGELYDKVKKALKDGNFNLYDLYLLENNLEVQPDGTITIAIPVPNGYDGAQCKLYRVNEDGSVSEVSAVLKDGKLTFETDQMGAFAVYQPVKVDTDEPGGNDDTTKPGIDDTTKPGDNDDTTKPGDNDGTTEPPKTGDSAPVALMLTVSLCSLAALAVLGKKKKAVK